MNNELINELLCILGISDDISNVSIRDIRVAFRKKALLLHPDKAGDVKTAAFQKLRSAYEELMSFVEKDKTKAAQNVNTVEENDEEVFFRDNFQQFNFPQEN